ncbi:hypothetical protein BDD12DRAFT_647120, partial [Trichophaea hybrida]
IVKALLRTCAHDNGHSDNKTPLIISVQKGLGAATRLFLDEGSDVNATDNSGQTALHYAKWSGDQVIVQLLLGRGANTGEL